jgi:hypothetical protein
VDSTGILNTDFAQIVDDLLESNGIERGTRSLLRYLIADAFEKSLVTRGYLTRIPSEKCIDQASLQEVVTGSLDIEWSIGE